MNLFSLFPSEVSCIKISNLDKSNNSLKKIEIIVQTGRDGKRGGEGGGYSPIFGKNSEFGYILLFFCV